MDTFGTVLKELREDRTDLFEAGALEPPQDPQVSVADIPMVTETTAQTESDSYQGIDYRDRYDNLQDLFEDLPTEEESFEDRPRIVGVERLAVYLPFHFYPDGHWGVRFFERPMLVFSSRLHALGRRLGYGWDRMLRIATYCIARHEFQHYLTELLALDLELKLGRKVYRPYWDFVYKPTYPNEDCIEETVANVWLFENAVARSPVELRVLIRSMAAGTPWPAYRNGASYDAQGVRPIEDRLAAQG